ncbi:MAG TPA: hypothetical protein VM889_12555 [Candidatus Thermoplasmatota archaeon]|nr:hypothetical protein [Candidatus Thermoplasmatota archaeon]
MKSYIPTLSILLMLAASMPAQAQTTTAAPVYLSVTLKDLVVLSNDSATPITLTLERNGASVGSVTQSVTSDKGSASLQGITATGTLPDDAGGLAAGVLTAIISVRGAPALSISGAPEPMQDGRLIWRTISLSWPTASPIRPSGQDLMLFNRGWSSDTLTLLFSPAPGVNLSGATVELQAWSGTQAAKGALLNSTSAPIQSDAPGVAYAVLELDHLPPQIVWRGRLAMPNGSNYAYQWSELDFATGSSPNGGYTRGTPPIIQAAASKHRVEQHTETVTVQAEVLTGQYTQDLQDHSGDKYDRIEGEDVSGLLPFFTGERTNGRAPVTNETVTTEPVTNALTLSNTQPCSGGWCWGDTAMSPEHFARNLIVVLVLTLAAVSIIAVARHRRRTA